jgi:hypothetical protein
MINKRLDDLCKNIDISQSERVAAMYAKHGVDPCKALFGCESMQYGCRSWQCRYDKSKRQWQNDPSQRQHTVA